MAASRARALVGTSWLKKQLAVAPRTTKVLYVSSGSMKHSKAEYLSKHIPGAQFFDLTECTTPTPLIPRNLPDPGCIQEYVRSLGVSKQDDVVVYDSGTFFGAARAWWTFRLLGHENAAVLDGGLRKWEKEGLGLEEGESKKQEAGDFEVSYNSNLLRTFEDVVNMVEDGSCQIVDARNSIHFRGEDKEPAPATEFALKGVGMPLPSHIKEGHIKGAINVPFESMFQPGLTKYSLFLDSEHLLKVFQDAGIDLSSPITTTCYIGHTSCILALGAYLCGKTDVANYYGSWTEFGQRGADEHIRCPAKSSEGPTVEGKVSKI